MHTIPQTFRPHHTAESHRILRGLGLATVLFGLTVTAMATHRTAAVQPSTTWSAGASAEPATFESGVPLEIFPLGTMAPEAAR
jgi:hypothetical protein